MNQILGVTMDSALNNDTMVKHLATLLNEFLGASNQVHCFLHILNLVAKSVLVQFDPPKADTTDVLAEGLEELAALERDLEDVDESDGEDNEEEDDISDLLDEREDMTRVEIEELEASVLPVRLALTKASDLKLCLDLDDYLCLMFSFVRSPSPSRTPPPSSCQNGIQPSKN